MARLRVWLMQLLVGPEFIKKGSEYMYDHEMVSHREKTCLRRFANSIGADQPAHLRSLISAFVIRLLGSIISLSATSEISFF